MLVSTGTLTVQETAEQLFILVDSESGPDGKRKVRRSLKRFLAAVGPNPINGLTANDLLRYKKKLVEELAPNTINDYLTYTRRLLNFAWETGAVEHPFRLKVLKNVNRPPLRIKGIKPADLCKLLSAVNEVNQPCARLMLLQFLCVLRPSEAATLLHRRGEQQSDGTFAIPSKTTRRSGELRRVLLSEEASRLLALIPTTYDTGAETKLRMTNGLVYAKRVWKVGRKLRETKGDEWLRSLIGKADLSPHFLRHSAVQALIDAEVREEYIRTAMGRLKPRVDRTYGAENYTAAREAIAVLSTLVPLSTIGIGTAADTTAE
jgi:site-specific recombinase XerD